MALGSEDREFIITREELEQKTSRWLLNEDAASSQAFDTIAHAYLEKLHYKLYKYQRVLYSEAEKDNYLRLKNHLKCHKISLSCPSKFNDPFDCQFAFPDDLGGKLFRMSKNSLDAVWRVGCLTEHANNRLMWSHYADSHRGICIEYDFSNFSAFLDQSLFAPVIYSSKRPQFTKQLLDHLNHNQLNLQDRRYLTSALFTKDTIWEYESEWRILKGVHVCTQYGTSFLCSMCYALPQAPACYQETPPYIEFKMPPISAVYFGAAMGYSSEGQAAKKELQNLCERTGIQTFSMQLDLTGYNVRPEPIHSY